MSSNDFDGPHFGSAGGRGADEQGAQALGTGNQSTGGQGTDGTSQGTGGKAAQYPAPEGWGNDGIYRDSAIDANYETGVQGAVRSADGSHEEPGYSYFSDGKGWENKPAANQAGQAPAAAAPSVTPADATAAGGTALGATAAGGTAIGATTVGAYGPGGDATSVYGAGAGGYAAPMGPGPGGPGGYGGGPGGPYGGGPGGPFGAGPGGPGGPVRPGGPFGPGGPRGPRGRNGKIKGSWWRHWSWKKAAGVAGGVFVFFMIVMFGGYEYMSSSATIPAALASATYQNTTVYYSDGKTVMGTIGTTNRQDLTYQQIPQQLQNAVVAAEDKGFWTEGGISPTGILRAAIHDVTSGGGSLNGGSTITQEFVRGYYDGVGTQQTATRKIKEIFIAQKLAGSKSKQWIMTNYLNLIYLGDNSYGVAAAAQTYFGVPVSKLTVAQDAVIAGIIQQPSTFPLPSNRAALKARWQYVLQQMVNDKYITQAQMDSAKFPTLLTDKNGAAAGASIMADDNSPWVPYIMSQVKNELTSPKANGGDGLSSQEVETGGLKIVTTISRSMEKEMYKAVNDNLSSSSLASASPPATVTKLPSWALVGAQLQDPQTGEIIGEYPGRGNDQNNTAAYTREQVGSSFKPYVLATAVTQGMNVKTSTLDTSPYVCVLPDGLPQDYSVPISAGTYNMSGNTSAGCPSSSDFKVQNDGGEFIGKNVGTVSGAPAYSDNVQDALAQSSNTGFTDLAHKVGTANIVKMADAFGVNTADFPNGSGLAKDEGHVGMALGIDALTVGEQTSMLATVADNGMYHQAHIVKYWQQNDGTKQMPQVAVHSVLTPTEAAQVQYAMEQTTIDGTAAQTVTFGQQTPGTVIGKTGTTSSSHAGFFIGSTTQYTLVVGMFTSSQSNNYPNNLAMLGGGGFGGYWPAKIWNTIAQDKFSTTPTLFPANPAFTGSAWNLLGQVTKPKPTVNCTINGHKKRFSGKTCPSQNNNNGPNPSPTCTWDNNGNFTCTNGGTSATPTATCQFQGDPTCNGTNKGNGGTSATPTPTCQFQGDPTCNGTNSFGANTTPTSTAQAGLAFGGGLTVLPGSLLWTTLSRRRRRRRTGAAE